MLSRGQGQVAQHHHQRRGRSTFAAAEAHVTLATWGLRRAALYRRSFARSVVLFPPQRQEHWRQFPSFAASATDSFFEAGVLFLSLRRVISWARDESPLGRDEIGHCRRRDEITPIFKAPPQIPELVPQKCFFSVHARTFLPYELKIGICVALSKEPVVEADAKPSDDEVVFPAVVPRPLAVTAKVFVPAPEPDPTPASVSPASELPDARPRAVTSKLFAPAPRSSPALLPFSRPQAATSKIFAPRTEDMNKGFLMFSEEEPGLTILKDEPDDLTHLAPTAGDADVPLETNFFMSDMFDDFVFCPLLTEDLNDSRSSHSGSNKSEIGSSNSSSNGDPFISYRDESCSSGGSPNSHLLSPSLSKSPGECSVNSACSPGDDDNNNVPPFLSMHLDSTSISDADDELNFRAPFIPTGSGDDFPLLMSTDLMWGAPPSSKNKSNWSMSESQSTVKTNLNSSLAKLLCAENNSGLCNRPLPIKCNDHGGGLVDPSEALGQVLTKDHSASPTGSMDWTAIRGLSLQKGGGAPNMKTCGSPERPSKRLNTAIGDDGTGASKRTKGEIKTPPRATSELLQQLIRPTGGVQKARSRATHGDSVWVLDGGGTRTSNNKQPSPVPSNSVLMNLLVSGCDGSARRRKGGGGEEGPAAAAVVLDANIQLCKTEGSCVVQDYNGTTCSIRPRSEQREASIRKNSFSLLDPEGATIPSLVDLSQRDYDVNAPVVSSGLLQGQELLKALEGSSNALVD
ncbi:hypothetical protein C0J52_02961 [Blattella germanica]|nr:hypothetical protein C0J52_02961 [Blattella germanica]